MLQRVAAVAETTTERHPLPAFRGRVVPLDGLRGLAALLVVFHHCFIWPMLFAKGITSGEMFHANYGHNVPLTALWYGYSGVELFFLLSGFCLLYPVFSLPHRAFSTQTYAVHRFRRIYPPYLATLFLAVCLAAVAWSKINAHLHYATEAVTVHNVVTALTLTQAHFCAPFWSLVVEAQWYFIVPLLALLWKQSAWAMHAGMLTVIATVTVLGELARPLHLEFLGLNLLARYLPLFWIGIVLAEVATSESNRVRMLLRRGGWLVLLTLGAAAISLYAPPPGVWTQARVQAYSFAILYAGVLAAALFTRFGQNLFSREWLVKAGAFSYSLYLIHALVVYVAIVFLDHYHITGRAELVVCLTALPAVCTGVGYVFYLAVEKQVQLKSGSGRRRIGWHPSRSLFVPHLMAGGKNVRYTPLLVDALKALTQDDLEDGGRVYEKL